MDRSPDIEAQVTYLPTSEGGRSAPVWSGYRPHHLVTPDCLTSGQHEYLDVDEVEPGETARAEIWFMKPEAYPNTMWVDRVIEIQEGSRLVGHAKVTKVINEILRRHEPEPGNDS